MRFRAKACVRFVLVAVLLLIQNKSAAGQQPPNDKADRPIVKKKEKLDRFGDPLPEGARLRLGTERFRLGGYRAPVAFFPSGAFIAAAADGYLILFDAERGNVVKRIRFKDKVIEDLAISPNGKRIITVGYKRIGDGVSYSADLTVWDAKALVELKTIPGDERNYPRKVILLPGGKVAATADRAGVALWDLEGAEELPRLPTAEVYGLAVSPDGSLLAVVDARGTIYLWEWRKKTDARRIESPDSPRPISLAFSPIGKTLAAGYDSDDGVTLFDVATGKRLRTLARDTTRFLTSLVFTPDGKHLITPAYDYSLKKIGSSGVYVWDAATGKQIRFLATPGEGPHGVSLFRDGSRLAAASSGSIHVWDTKTWKELAADETSYRAEVLGIAMSKNGLILTGSNDHTARLWDLKDGRPIHKFPCRYWVHSVALTPDGSRAAGLDKDEVLLVWDTATGKTIFKLPGHGPFAETCIGISADGKRLLSFSMDDLYLRVTDLANGKAIAEHAIRPEGVQIADPETDTEFARGNRHMIFSQAAFTPDGKLFLRATRRARV